MTCSTTISTDQASDPRPSGGRPIVVGVLSDTHGYLYPEVVQALARADRIIHAGDVGSERVLAALRKLAPVTAVRGNCDLDLWAEALPLTAELELGGARILVGHIAARLRERLETAAGDPGTAYTVVISGHSHLPAVERHDRVLLLNPGSAGPGRFGRPRTVARLSINPAAADGPGGPTHVAAEIVAVPW